MSQTGKLISLIKQYPILYDISHEDYRSTKKKDDVWQEISDEMNQRCEDIKRKWKNLRDTFAKYLKMTKTKTGHQRKKMPKKWQWASHMEDFSPHLSFSKKITGVSEVPGDEDEPNDDVNGGETFEIIEMDSTDIELEEKIIPDLCDIDQTSPIEEAPPEPPIVQPTPIIKRKRRRRNEFAQPTSVDYWMKYVKSKKKTEMDDTDLLFAAHAQCVKKFSLKRQAITKMKIAQVVMEQELLNLEEMSENQNNLQSSKPSCSSRSMESTEDNSSYYEFKEPSNGEICEDYKKVKGFMTDFAPTVKNEKVEES